VGMHSHAGAWERVFGLRLRPSGDNMLKKLRLKGKALASRLTGISSGIVGFSWTPPTDEKDKARRLLVFLEDRRVLYQPHQREISPHVVKSILEIRQRLTKDLEDLPQDSPLGESIIGMRAACRKFLDETSYCRDGDLDLWAMPQALMFCLGELRALFGIHVAKIALMYDLELEGELARMVPNDPVDDKQ